MVEIAEAVFSGVLKPLGDVVVAEGPRVPLVVEPIDNGSTVGVPAGPCPGAKETARPNRRNAVLLCRCFAFPGTNCMTAFDNVPIGACDKADRARQQRHLPNLFQAACEFRLPDDNSPPKASRPSMPGTGLASLLRGGFLFCCRASRCLTRHGCFIWAHGWAYWDARIVGACLTSGCLDGKEIQQVAPVHGRPARHTCAGHARNRESAFPKMRGPGSPSPASFGAPCYAGL
jgi:hypothetical protein